MSKDYTPHINANKGDFAETVLMPGDPKRSRFIAENFLNSARLVNDVRGVQGYTGFYKGAPVSVMASGMGMPSMAIYSYELFNFFDVQNIIRVGSAGSYREEVKVRDIILASGACTNSNFASNFELPGNFAPIADFELLSRAVNNCKEKGVKFHVGNIFSSDVFYGEKDLPDYKNPVKAFAKMGVLGVEMEAAALYMNAARSGKKALAICTVSDSLVTGDELSAEDRQNSFTDMIKIALNTAI
ncbi:MAG: purine-nucleoside phosphorylase [Clostridia bacterium]|nr:purine-nucleoside phosphorylase [Clostridia bacterium]